MADTEKTEIQKARELLEETETDKKQRTEEFIKELNALQEKYRMVIIPQINIKAND